MYRNRSGGAQSKSLYVKLEMAGEGLLADNLASTLVREQGMPSSDEAEERDANSDRASLQNRARISQSWERLRSLEQRD